MLLDLYDEQVRLEERLTKTPNNRQLSERYKRVVTLADKLRNLGSVLNRFDSENLAGTPDLS